MGWDGLAAVLVFLNIGLAGCVFIMAKQLRELQQWRQAVTEICRQQVGSGDYA